MCNDCHKVLANDQVLKRLNAVSRDDFYLFNGTSVNHLRIAASGANGPEVKTRAEQILKEYEQWQANPPQPSLLSKKIAGIASLAVIGACMYFFMY